MRTIMKTIKEAKNLLPSAVWKDPYFFNSTISDSILAITQLPKDQLLSTILGMRICEWEPKEKGCLWLALAYGCENKGITDEMLLIFSGYFHLGTAEALILAAAFSRSSYLEKFTRESFTGFPSIPQAQHTLALEKARANGHEDIIAHITELTPRFKKADADLTSPGAHGIFPPSNATSEEALASGSQLSSAAECTH